jgi:ABC-2 type transport system ATP-binding protein
MMPAPTRAAVRFEGVHIVFQTRFGAPVWALRGLDLVVPEGAVMGLLGPNGAGKTTAISCMLALLEPHAGAIQLWGEAVSASHPRHGARCGVLLEDTRLPPFLPVRAALEIVCAMRKVARPAAELDRVVAKTRIGDLLSRTVFALSKGQARRVGLAAALIGDPPLLVLDEPSAGLDAEARVEFEQLVHGLRDGSRTMIIASHLLGDVEATCTHIAVMRSGRVLLAGSSRDLLAEARRGQDSEVHVEATQHPTLDAIGIAHAPSRYPGLVLLSPTIPDEELFATLAQHRILPRRVEPRVSVLSLYLDVTRAEDRP